MNDSEAWFSASQPESVVLKCSSSFRVTRVKRGERRQGGALFKDPQLWGSHRALHPSNLRAQSQFLQPGGSKRTDRDPLLQRKPGPYTCSHSQNRDNLYDKPPPWLRHSPGKPKYTQENTQIHTHTNTRYLHLLKCDHPAPNVGLLVGNGVFFFSYWHVNKSHPPTSTPTSTAEQVKHESMEKLSSWDVSDSKEQFVKLFLRLQWATGQQTCIYQNAFRSLRVSLLLTSEGHKSRVCLYYRKLRTLRFYLYTTEGITSDEML